MSPRAWETSPGVPSRRPAGSDPVVANPPARQVHAHARPDEAQAEGRGEPDARADPPAERAARGGGDENHETHHGDGAGERKLKIAPPGTGSPAGDRAPPLVEHRVAPDAVVPSDTLAAAKLPEPARLVQPHAGRVLGEDRRLQGPDALRRSEEHTSELK